MAYYYKACSDVIKLSLYMYFIESFEIAKFYEMSMMRRMNLKNK